MPESDYSADEYTEVNRRAERLAGTIGKYLARPPEEHEDYFKAHVQRSLGKKLAFLTIASFASAGAMFGFNANLTPEIIDSLQSLAHFGNYPH